MSAVDYYAKAVMADRMRDAGQARLRASVRSHRQWPWTRGGPIRSARLRLRLA